MGGLALKAVSKKGKDKLSTSYQSLFDIPTVDIDGKIIENLGSVCQGKKCIMVVNVASKWGLTDKTYTQMVRLHRQYRDQGFEILAFPCNQFMSQEPGTDAEIKAFAQNLYSAEFPLFAKTEVNGEKTCEVYKYLRNNSELYDTAKHQAKEIPWNFAKFFVNAEGKVVSYFPPKTLPDELENNIKTMLKWKK